MGAPLEQLSSLVGRERISEPERSRVLRHGLAVRACRSSPRTCLWCPPQDLLAVADRFGVMRQPCRIRLAARWRGQRRQRGTMQRQPAIRRHRPLHCLPRQLVPERDAPVRWSDHARGRALLQACDRPSNDRFQQPQLDPTGDDRHSLKQPPPVRRAPSRAGENRVPDRVRDPLTARRERLRQKKRVAARLQVQLFRVHALGFRELADRPL